MVNADFVPHISSDANTARLCYHEKEN